MNNERMRQNPSVSSAFRIALFAFLAAVVFVLPLVPSAHAATVNVRIVDFAFQPTPITVQLFDTVVWTNDGTSPHSVISDGGLGPLSSSILNNGENFSFQFTSEGIYKYHCGVHSTMKGTVNVGSVIPEYSDTAFVVLGLLVVLLGIVAVRRRR